MRTAQYAQRVAGDDMIEREDRPFCFEDFRVAVDGEERGGRLSAGEATRKVADWSPRVFAGLKPRASTRKPLQLWRARTGECKEAR
jgi:hypothetical protein